MVFQVTSVLWKENVLSLVDTPGHADFGGEINLAFQSVNHILFCFFGLKF
jgi:predicted membrane GTPase involved in stress response